MAFGVVVVAALLQTTVFPALSLNAIHPDVMLVVALSWSFLLDFRQAAGWAFAGGILLDMFSPAGFGVFTATLTGIAWLGSLWRGRFSGSAWLVAVLLALPHSIVYNMMTGLLVGTPLSWRFAFLQVIFPSALLDVLAMALVLPLSVWLTRFQRRDGLIID